MITRALILNPVIILMVRTMSIDLHIVLHINSTNSVQFFSVQLGDVGVGSCTGSYSCAGLVGTYNVYFVLVLL